MNYKLVQFDNVDQITGRLLEYFKDLLDSKELYGRLVSLHEISKVVPELLDQFNKKGLNLDTMRVFATPPGKKLPIHVDGSYNDRKDVALNWPIANCTNTRMQWFKAKDNDDFVRQSDDRYGKGIRCFADDDCTLIDELELTGPAVVKINVPHTVENNSDKNRVIISFRFYNKPEAVFGTQ